MRPTAHVLYRDPPNLNERIHKMETDPDHFKNLIFSRIPNYEQRTPGQMPSQQQLSALNKTERRFAKAHVHYEKFTLASPNLPNQDEENIGELAECDAYLQVCLDIIEFMVLSDFRFGLEAGFVSRMPLPSCLHSCTTLVPLEEHERCLGRVGMKHWIIMLANAMHLFFVSGLQMSVLKIVHELHAHANSMNWAELADDPITRPYDESYFRYTLALLGCRTARILYRKDPQERAHSPYDSDPGYPFLLNEVETFCREQIKYRPKAATGYWYMGWVAEQRPSIRGVNQLVAAADTFSWYKKAYEVADAEGHDIISACARIDGAMYIQAGGRGMMAIGSMNAVVRRNFESSFAYIDPKKKKEKKKLKKGGVHRVPIEIKCCRDTAHAQQVLRYETDRRQRGEPDEKLEPGDKCLVEWWDIVKLWNDAMRCYDRLERIQLGDRVCGECSCFYHFSKQLKWWTEEDRLNFEDEQFAIALTDLPIQNTPDLGFRLCANCGVGDEGINKHKACARCKTVHYCSRECQKQHWKTHKPRCNPCRS